MKVAWHEVPVESILWTGVRVFVPKGLLMKVAWHEVPGIADLKDSSRRERYDRMLQAVYVAPDFLRVPNN